MPDYIITFYAGGLAHPVSIQAPSLEAAEDAAHIALEQPCLDFSSTHKRVRIFTAQVGAVVVQPAVDRSDAPPTWNPQTKRIRGARGKR